MGFLLLGGCGSHSPEDLLQDYVERIGNLTEIEPAEGPLPALPDYPAPRDLVITTDDLRVNLADFLSLGECGLLGKISERNGPLGRLQRETGRLLYELEFYRVLKSCGQRVSDPAFRRQVESILISKRGNLPVVFWNASFAAREFRNFFSTATDPLQRDETLTLAAFQEPLQRLAVLGRQLEEAPEIDPHAFERLYAGLQADKVGGRILRGLALTEFHLNQAAGLLEAAGERRLCPMGRKTPTAEYLFNVFVKYYAGGVQPYVSRLHQAGAVLQTGVEGLAGVQRVPFPPAFSTWYGATWDRGNEASLWRRYSTALQRHTKSWQDLLRPCGLMPAGPIKGS